VTDVVPADEGGVQWDAPNQQVVRPDESAPWEEGEGGSEHPSPKDEGGGGVVDLEAMTKDQLLAYAQAHGVSPANAAMNKADIVASIQAAGAG